MVAWRSTDELLQDGISACPVLVAGVTTRDGVVYRFARGRGPTTGRSIDFDSIFWIASMTKALTSVAAMQLVEQNELPLDTPIGAVLPQLDARRILDGFDASGAPKLRDASKKITLAHLLAHTSGFAENVWSHDMLRYVEATGTPTGDTAKRTALDLPLLFEPGSAWHYGISHDWVGLAVEAASGLRLDRYFADRLFGPLGMVDTAYFPDESQKPRIAPVHARAADGALTRFERKLPAERDFLSGGGTIYSTADDYLAFVRMMLNDGEAEGGRILSRATVDRMSENRTPGMQVSHLDPAIPAMSNPVEMLPGVDKCWGLGMMVNLEPLATGRQAGSLSWAGLGNTYFWIDRASGIGGVLLTQILPFADRRTLDLFERFEESAYAALGR